MQPNYQQYPPQGYGYPPQGGAPVSYPQFQPPAPTPQQAVAANLPQGDFADPRGAGGGELAPKIRHMAGDVGSQPPKRGRTVIIEPIRIDENAKGLPRPDGTVPVNPCAYANVTIVDGGPIEFGDEWKASRQVRPNTHRSDTPLRIMNMMIGNTWIVNAIRDAMPPLGNGLLLGVIETGTQGNNPFLLTKCEVDVMGNDRPDGAQRREAARQLWQQIKAGTFVNPTPTLLVPQQTYDPASYATQGAPIYQAPQPVNTALSPQPWVPQQPIQQAPAPQGAGLPPNFDVSQPPPGWDAGAWAPFAANPAQAAAIWTNVLAQQNAPHAAATGQPAASPGW